MHYWYFGRKFVKARKLSKYEQISKKNAVPFQERYFGKCSLRKWFQEGNNLCSILIQWMPSFFPLWHHCKQCPWQKRNTDRSLKWFPSSSSWEPSRAFWLTDWSSFHDQDGKEDWVIFLVSWFMGMFFGKINEWSLREI